VKPRSAKPAGNAEGGPADKFERRAVDSIIPYARNARTIRPAYIDVAVERWQNFTGKKVTHAETGETFESMKARRHGEKAS
jgi:hypothetical protein